MKLTSRPGEEDNWYESRRVWTHSRRDWSPSWFEKLGWPHVGTDEWGRLVLTVGFSWLGYVSWAYRTCWKQCCHVVRQQQYEIEAQQWQEYQDKIARGQCTCWNSTIWQFNFWRESRDSGATIPRSVASRLIPTQRCSCGHIYREHDEDGSCLALNNTPTTP